MRAGRRDRYITFQRKTEAKDEIGHPVPIWASLRNEFAEVVPVRGGEALQFEREVTGRMSKFVVPWFSGLTAEDRIVYDGANWDIVFISEIGRREGLEIHAELLK